MAQISYIKYTEVLEARRYDAEYFKPEYLKTDKIIKTKAWKYFDKNIAEITGGNAFNSEGFGQDKTKVAKITEVSQEKDIAQWETISNEEINSFPKRFLQKGDILFSGTHHNYWDIGKVLFINFENIEATFNQRVFRIRFKKEINPEFGFVLFKTRFLRNQIEKFSRGNNQLNLNFTELNQFKIPILSQSFQLQIEEIVKSAHQKQTESKQLYHEAEELLLAELGLLNYEVKHSLWFTATKNEVSEAHRYDSEYFQPKYAEIIKKIENYEGGWDLVKNALNFKDKNHTPKADQKYKYLALSNISSQGYIQDYQEEFGKDLPSRARRKINTNDLIISSIEGSLSSCALVEKEFDNSICSTGFFVLNSEKINSETLLILFKSLVIQELLQRGSKGTILTAISKTELESIKIPLIKPSIQKQIAEKIQESHRLRKESKELLEDAKRKVEEEIEKST